MVTSEERRMSYAPAGNVLDVIHRLRDRGLPDVVTGQVLSQIGIAEGNISRTLGALRFLGLIDKEGQRTSLFNDLGRASTAEYPEILGSIIRERYNSIFKIIDPATATDIQLHDAFRHYQPEAQRARMVILFVGLCREAGLMPGTPGEKRSHPKKPARPAARVAPERRRGGPTPEPAPAGNDERASEQRTAPFDSMWPDAFKVPLPTSTVTVRTEYLLLAMMLQRLPVQARWTKEARDRWVHAFETNLDYLITVASEPAVKERESTAANATDDDEEG